MPKQRDIRRLAMQVLYQIDLRGTDDLKLIEESLTDGPDQPQVCQLGFQLAQEAWEQRSLSDELVGQLAPKWPTYRQPPVDRAIIRLACHEIATSRTPAGVAINEAIELAKQYGSEQSPAFINGVLDKIAKHWRNQNRANASDQVIGIHTADKMDE